MAFDTTRPAYRDALILQREAMEMVSDGEVKPVVKAQLMRAFCELEKLKRVMRGLPANTSQSIKSEPKQRKVRNQGPVEPVEVIEPVKQVDKPTIHSPGTIESASLPVNPLLSQPDSQPTKSTGAWAKAMGQDDPEESKHA